MDKTDKILRVYLILIIGSGVLIFLYFLLFTQYSFEPIAVIFITIMVIGEYFESVALKYAAFSLATSNIIFILLIFGPVPAMIGTILTCHFKSSICVFKKEYKHIINKKSLFNSFHVILLIAICYNVQLLLNIKYNDLRDLLKIILIVFIYITLNRVLVSIVISLDTRISFWKIINPQKVLNYIYYEFLFTIGILYAYIDRGIIGVAILWLIFIPLNKFNILYTKLKVQQEELFTDQLTGAYNYKFFENLINNKISTKEKFALIMLDLNRLKMINDTYGHSFGNEALILTSKIIKENLKNKCYFCRYGGDEFFIVAKDIDNIKKIAKQITTALTNTYLIYEGQHIYLTLSIGISEYIGDDSTSVQIIKKADQAMYKSKQAGDNIITIYEEA